MTDQEWKDVFQVEGPFSWWKWYGEGYPTFKGLLEQHYATFESDVIREGKCINCTARVAVQDLSLWFVKEKRRIELIQYRDACSCS